MIAHGMEVIDGIFCLSTVVLMEWVMFTRKPLNAVSAHRQIWNGKAIYFSYYFSMKTIEISNEERFARLPQVRIGDEI